MFNIILAAILVLLNGFFVAAEFGMVKLRTTRVDVLKDKAGVQGKILAKIHQNLDAYLSACQLGITLASLGLGWAGEPAFAEIIASSLVVIGLEPPRLIHLFSFILAFSLISWLHIIVGELMPKSIAIRRAEEVSLHTAIPLYLFYWFMYPAIWFLNSCSNYLLRPLKMDSASNEGGYSTEELKLLLSSKHMHEELSPDEIAIIHHALELSDLKVSEVMRSIDEAEVLDINQPVDSLFEKMLSKKYSRYPVVNGSNKEVLGFIHIKDIMALWYEKRSIHDLRPLIRPIMNVSKEAWAIDLLQEFQMGSSHFALVFSGQGDAIGFVTLDNILQVLLGRIRDEFHKTKTDYQRKPDGSILATGNCPLYAIENLLAIQIPEEENIETLNGLLMHRLGGLPKTGEYFIWDDFEVRILDASPSKIRKVILFPSKK